ncbi:MAG: hypothetical protein IH881_09485 [Myxococcales bacterium]|nr:hypothetical protein [Myxococcales bacterium]
MKRTITGMTLVLALFFTATVWSQESTMERGKMGMGMMKMGESPQMETCMQMMGKMEMEDMETTNEAVDELVGRMRAADGAEKMAAMEELLTVLVAQRRQMHKMMRGMPKMMCGGMMGMMMK